MRAAAHQAVQVNLSGKNNLPPNAPSNSVYYYSKLLDILVFRQGVGG
jgi:hypothetical protein